MLNFLRSVGERMRGGRTRKEKRRDPEREEEREAKRAKRFDASPAETVPVPKRSKKEETKKKGNGRANYKMKRSPLAKLRGRPAILFTCITSGSDKKALGEAWDLIDDALDELYPREVPQDLQAAAKLPQRFLAHDLDTDGVLYFTMEEEGLEVVKIVKYIARNYSLRVRFLGRIIPLSAVCYASQEEVIDTLVPLLTGLEGKSYAIDMKRRNNDIFPRDDAIAAVALCIPKRSYRVDLAKPDSTICVHVFKSLAGISVVPGFYDLFDLNLGKLKKNEGKPRSAAAASS